MAPPPEYDKEPKAPDKSATNISTEDSKLLQNLVNDQHTNSDHKSTNTVTAVEIENKKHVETLDDGQLKALLDEAINYKNPKDREGKSDIFKELLEKAEQESDEQACSAAARTLSGCRSSRRGRRGPALAHSNSLQDLVAALAAEQPRPRHTRQPPPHPAPNVSARAIHGGSLPSGVDTSSLSEEPARAGYLATVRCVNPPPLAERRVSASDANAPAEMELLNRRSKPMFPMTYTARATLEIGSGAVCSGRAVTTTTASNQVRTAPPATATTAARQVPVSDPQVKLMNALCPRTDTDQGGCDDPIPQVKDHSNVKEPDTQSATIADLKGKTNIPRGPMVDNKEDSPGEIPKSDTKPVKEKSYYEKCPQSWVENVDNWYKSLPLNYPEHLKNMYNDIFKINKLNNNKDIASVKTPKNSEINTFLYPKSTVPSTHEVISTKDDDISQAQFGFGVENTIHYSPKFNKTKFQTESLNVRHRRKYDDNKEIFKESYSNFEHDIIKRKLKKSHNSVVPYVRDLNPRNVRPMSIGGPPINSQNGLNTNELVKTSQKNFEDTDIPIDINSKTVNKEPKNTPELTDKSSNNVEDATPELIDKSSNNVEDVTPELTDKSSNNVEDATSEIIDKSSDNVEDATPQLIDKSSNNVEDAIDKSSNNVEDATPELTDKSSNNVEDATSELIDKSSNNVEDAIPELIDKSSNNVENATPELINKSSNNVEDATPKLIDKSCNNVEHAIPELIDISSNNIENADPELIDRSSNNVEGANIKPPILKCTSEYCDTSRKREQLNDLTDMFNKLSNYVSDDIELTDIKSKQRQTDDNDSFSKYVALQQKLLLEIESLEAEIKDQEQVDHETNEADNSETESNMNKPTKIEENLPSANATSKDSLAIVPLSTICEDTNKGVGQPYHVKETTSKNDSQISAELSNNAYVLLTLPSSNNTEYFISESTSKTKTGKKKDNLSLALSHTNKKEEVLNKNILKVLLFENLFKNNNNEKSGTSEVSAIINDEVDSAISFSCITTPEVVASCNTTSSATQSAVAVDPKPRSVIASSFNGLPMSRSGYGATGTPAPDEYKKSIDENGNSVQGFSSPLSGSSQHKKPRRKKSSKNETVIDCQQIDGYQGDKDVNELLRFIESDADHGRGKLRAKQRDDDDKGKKRRKDKDKPKRASSLDELSRAARAPPERRAPPPPRRSWGDEREPEPAPAAPETDFQTVTKKRRARRRADDAEREPPRRRAPGPRRRESAPPSERSADSNDDLDSVHSLPDAPRAPPAHASYADIARTRHNIPDLIESCNFYAEGEGRAEPAPPGDADGYPALEARARRRDKPPPPAPRRERKPAGAPREPPAPDVVADRPPVVLLDSAARPRDMDGVTFGFDVNEQLLSGGGRRARVDLLRDALAPAALRYVPPPPPPPAAAAHHHHHLAIIVDYVGSAWEDVVRCGSGKVRYFSE